MTILRSTTRFNVLDFALPFGGYARKMIMRMISLVALLVSCLAMVSGKPAWGSHDQKAIKTKKPSGHNDLMNGDIDFDSLSPKDCASYLCANNLDLATQYIESGCPGPLANFEVTGSSDMQELATTLDDAYDE